MPRDVIERTFPNGLDIPMTSKGTEVALEVVGHNAEEGVTQDKKNTFCVYDGPAPETIGKVAERNGLPVDRISEVRVLDRYFYP
jgi:hypothetical protein